MADVVSPHRSEILKAVRRHRAFAPRVFGSVARGEARPESDLDLLVRFRRGADLLDQVRLRRDLEEIVGRRVDVATEESLRWYVAPQALEEAVTL